MAADYWTNCGYSLLGHDERGRLLLTDDFLRAYLLRPELAPSEESCAAERALHAALLERPDRPITPVNLVRLKDGDARENWQVFAAFRAHLQRHATIEDAYLGLFTGEPVPFPAMFLDHLVQVILRNMAGPAPDPFRLRAAECLFRSQQVTPHDGAILLADEETVQMHARSGGFGSLGELLVHAEAALRTVELDVLTEANASGYLGRADRYDTVLDLTFARPGLDALCRVLEHWVGHLLDVAISIQPQQSIRDEHWAWHTGLDREASAILDNLWRGQEIPDERRARLLSLFRLEFRDLSLVRAELCGKPVYLGLAMDADGRLRMKPQNLLVNLPLQAAS